MKNKLNMLALCLLIAHFSYSQRLQIEGNDTLAVIPIENIRTANTLFLQSDSIAAELENAKIQIKILDSINKTITGIINLQNQQLQLKEKNEATLKNKIKTLQSSIPKQKTNSILQIGKTTLEILILIALFFK